MKTEAFKERIDSSVNSFFSPDETSAKNLIHSHETSVFKNGESASAKANKYDSLVNYLKIFLVFLPGIFFLFFSSIFFLFAFFSTKLSMLDFSYGLLFWALSIFMTYFGAGSLSKTKNLSIPASTVGIALVFYLVSEILPGTDQKNLLFDYSPYLFPIVLLAAFWVKSTVRKSEDQTISIDRL